MQPSFAMLLKTHIEKMSHFRLLAMLMKTNALSDPSRDVYENTGSYGNFQRRSANSDRRSETPATAVFCLQPSSRLACSNRSHYQAGNGLDIPPFASDTNAS